MAYDTAAFVVHRLAALTVPITDAKACHGGSPPAENIDDALAVRASPAMVMVAAVMAGTAALADAPT